MTTLTLPVTLPVSAEKLLEVAQRNYSIILRQVDGLTHADSLLQLPFRGNCLNWVIGHMVQSRNRMLDVCGEDLVWTPEQVARYERDSPPVTMDGPDVVPLEKMLADLKTANERLANALGRFTPEDLLTTGKEVIKGAPAWNIAEWLHFLLWHETYHVGQTELLRQLAGTNDKVI